MSRRLKTCVILSVLVEQSQYSPSLLRAGSVELTFLKNEFSIMKNKDVLSF